MKKLVIFALCFSVFSCEKKTEIPVKITKEKTQKKSPEIVKKETTPIKKEKADGNNLGPGSDEQIQLLIQAKTALISEDWEASDVIFKKLVATEALSSPRVTAYIALSNSYRDSEKPDKAVELLNELESMVTELPEVHFVLARAYGDLRQFDKSILAYEKTLKLQPDYLQALIELGGTYLKTGRKEEGEKMFYAYEKQIHKFAKVLENPKSAEADQLHVLDVFDFLDDDRANQSIVRALDADFPKVREKAINLIQNLRLGSTQEKLEKMMNEDINLRVRMTAKEALLVIHGAPKTGEKPVVERPKKKAKNKKMKKDQK